MDANQTKFHLLLGKADWAGSLEDDRAFGNQTLDEIWAQETKLASPPNAQKSSFYWNSGDDEISLQKRLFQFIAAKSDNPPKLENRRGAARDRYGNWYWIDETNLKIRVLSVGSNRVSDFYPVKTDDCQAEIFGGFRAVAGAPLSIDTPLRGLCVTVDHYLVVGTLEPAGLLVFDLFATGEPRRILWNSAIEFAPFDIAARHCGGAFVLDRQNRRYWTLDRYFNLFENSKSAANEVGFDVFQSVNPDDEQRFSNTTAPTNFAAGFALPLNDPIAIEALPDDTVLILDHQPEEKFAVIYRYDGERQLDQLQTETFKFLVEENQREDFKLIGYDLAFVAAEAEKQTLDRIYLASATGNQTYAFNLLCGELVDADSPPQADGLRHIRLEPVAEYLPMRLFGGKGLVAAENAVYYDFGERWLKLIEQRRPRFALGGTLLTRSFDGREPNCVWHRLLVDGCIPPETSVEAWSRTAETKEDLQLATWQREPAFYLRNNGSEIPFAETKKKSIGNSSSDGTGTWELLLQRAKGRWLQLKLVFTGNGQKSPSLQALRIYYPRFSYLKNYLPAIYREDEMSAFFLERFLANLEGFYTSIEDRIAAAQMLFDVRSAPAETLEWLASWFGVVLDPAWDESKRRLFIRHALDFFQYRGTLRGLRTALRLALDSCADERIFESTGNRRQLEHIRIVEKYLTRRVFDEIVFNPDELTVPQNKNEATRWRPEQGSGALHALYQEFLIARAKSPEEKQSIANQTIKFPLSPPQDADEFSNWQQFTLQELGFVPSNAARTERLRWQAYLAAHHSGYFADTGLPRDLPTDETRRGDWHQFIQTTIDERESWTRKTWQDFLARRYQRVGKLNEIYATHWISFDEISLFDELPAATVQLGDWYQFESVVLASHRTAHRFTVFVPLPLDVASAEKQRERMGLVERIVNLEKPAHTVFDVKFYWNLFRIGEARLEMDTLLGLGGRDPQLNPNFVLGQSYVGESSLGTLETISDRAAFGRKTLPL
ncbi:MAG: phage tail protein [Pyrinomonadaceae bacterium]